MREMAAPGLPEAVAIDFFGEHWPERPLLRVEAAGAAGRRLPDGLLAACQAQGGTGDFAMQVRTAANLQISRPHISILYVEAPHLPDAQATGAAGSMGDTNILCRVGADMAEPVSGFDAWCSAPDWRAAIALVRLLAPGRGIIGFAVADALALIVGYVVRCEVWPLGACPPAHAVAAESTIFGFSRSLRLLRIADALDAYYDLLPSPNRGSHANNFLTPITDVDALLGFAPGRKPA